MNLPRYIVLKLLATATLVVAVVACTPRLPDLRAPAEVNKEIPQTDVTVDAKKILLAHNEIRRQLSIPDLRWSNQMASYATRWAVYLTESGCQLRHRGNIDLPLHKNGLGENLFRRSAVVWADGRREVESVAEKDVVLEWARESANFNYVENSCALNETCEHYTQLVWRDSVVVGCGAASCPNQDQIWVCNYDPPGNFIRQRPY